MRQRSTLAHELAHALFQDRQLGASTDWSERSPQEIRADAFARHLLIPVQGVREFLGDTKPATEVDLSALVQRYLVSPAIAAIALHQASYIDGNTKKLWMEEVSAPKLAARYGWMEQYQALVNDSRTRRTPQRLLARAISGYELGVVSAQTIATLRHASLDDTETTLRQAGVTSAEPDIVWSSADNLPEVQVDLSDLEDWHTEDLDHDDDLANSPHQQECG